MHAADIPIGSKVRLTSRRSKRIIEGEYKGWGWNDKNTLFPVFYLVAITQTVIALRCNEFDLELL